jgi:DNA polymerase/3'-5' exonuclease PolX
MSCPDCNYLIEERAAIHQFEGGAPRADADRMAVGERCQVHGTNGTNGTNGKTKHPRAAALAVARELCRVFDGVSERLIVAGSLRRQKEMVGDVEILFIPKEEQREDPADLFGRKIPVDLANEKIEWLVKLGTLAKRPNKAGGFTWGPENKLAVHVASGIGVDLFAARPANWWNLLVCRTGSAESNERICNAAIRKGWKWQPYGAGFHDRVSDELVRRTQSERDVFEAVGLPYLEPWERV